MSDYADSNVFSGWGERDDRRLEDEREHDHADSKHQALLDRRDENLPYHCNPCECGGSLECPRCATDVFGPEKAA
jgi:hypothetical protein